MGKRRTHGEATDQHDWGLVPNDSRGASAVTPAFAREMLRRRAASGPEPSAEEVADIQARMGLTVVDPVTGELRYVNLDVPADQKLVFEQNGVRVLASNVGAEVPSDPRTGFVRMSKDDMPDGLRAQGLLPINPLMLSSGVVTSERDLRDMFVFFPLIPMPVKTPPLYLMITGTHDWPTQNSFHIMQYYTVALRMMVSSEVVRLRREVACAWLQEGARLERLDGVHVASFVGAITMKEDATNFPEDLQALADGDKLTPEVAEAFCKQIAAVGATELEPWRQGKVFAEDVVEDKVRMGEQFAETVAGELDRAVAQNTPRSEIVKMLYGFAFTAIHHYEIALYRLFTEAALKPAMEMPIPADYMCSTEVPPLDELHELLVPAMSKALEAMTQVRNTYLLGDEACVVPEAFAPDECVVIEDVSDDPPCEEGAAAVVDEREACLPSREQLHSFHRFLHFQNPGDEGMAVIAANIDAHVQMTMIEGPMVDRLRSMRGFHTQLDGMQAAEDVSSVVEVAEAIGEVASGV